MMESLTKFARDLDDSDQRQDLLLLQMFIQQGIAAKRASDTAHGSHKVGEEEEEEEEEGEGEVEEGGGGGEDGQEGGGEGCGGGGGGQGRQAVVMVVSTNEQSYSQYRDCQLAVQGSP